MSSLREKALHRLQLRNGPTVKHVIQKVEKHYRETDGIVEEAVDRVLIEVRREEEETSESEEAFVSGTDDPCSD